MRQQSETSSSSFFGFPSFFTTILKISKCLFWLFHSTGKSHKTEPSFDLIFLVNLTELNSLSFTINIETLTKTLPKLEQFTLHWWSAWNNYLVLRNQWMLMKYILWKVRKYVKLKCIPLFLTQLMYIKRKQV